MKAILMSDKITQLIDITEESGITTYKLIILDHKAYREAWINALNNNSDDDEDESNE